MKVSIIIPNYNGLGLLKKNLPLVLDAYKNKANKIYEVIVVDDGSTDKSVSFIKENFNSIRLIKHTANRGFSAAVNTGVRAAKNDLLCLLNTDVAPRDDFLGKVIPHFKGEDVFAVSLNEEGYSWARGFFRNGFLEHQPGHMTKITHQTFWVSGGSGVFKRKIWVKLGGLDEKLFSPLYWEDLDICYRAAKRGYSLLWEPEAIVIHQHESTVKTLSKRYVDRIRQRNQLIFIWKNITSQTLFRRHLAALVKRIILHPGYLVIFFLAFSKFTQIKRSRDKEIKESKVSDEAVFSKFG